MRAQTHPTRTRSVRNPPLSARGVAALLVLLALLAVLAVRPPLLFVAVPLAFAVPA